jgi:hypothetical protein
LEKSVNELKTLRGGGFDSKVLSRVLVEVILEGRGGNNNSIPLV